MKYVKEYLETVIKIKPLGELTTKENELYDMSGEMVYIDGKCSDIFISHADYANWLEKQGEQKPKGYTFKAIPRLLEMIEPTDRAKAYTAKLADTLEVEGYSTDAKIVRESLKIMNGEKVPMATMDKEPVSEVLDDAADSYTRKVLERTNCLIGNQSVGEEISKAVNFGAKWKVENLWKPADGDDLPEIDREVIALLDNGKVVYAHRPPEYWDGKNIATGKVTRNYPKTYDNVGWNIPNVKYWLDVKLPKEIEL